MSQMLPECQKAETELPNNLHKHSALTSQKTLRLHYKY
jgi:hypothetical protein